MGNDTMDVSELAAYLHRDVREVGKLASRGHLPGRKVGGEWRFARAEINYWLETQLHEYSEDQLTALEKGGRKEGGQDILLADMLAEECIAVPLPASTRASVLREMAKLAEQTWQVYDPEALLQAIQSREEQGTTALPGGVAIPHPHRPLPAALGESILAFGRTVAPIPFGGPRGEMTDIFFLLCCRDDRTHLRILARLTRLILRPGFLDDLRQLETPAEAHQKILQTEREILGLE